MTDNRAEMTAAILTAILESNTAADGSITVDGEAATEALILALATIFEADESISSPSDIRKVGEAVAAELRAKIKIIRKVYEATGRRNWDADLNRLHWASPTKVLEFGPFRLNFRVTTVAPPDSA